MFRLPGGENTRGIYGREDAVFNATSLVSFCSICINYKADALVRVKVLSPRAGVATTEPGQSKVVPVMIRLIGGSNQRLCYLRIFMTITFWKSSQPMTPILF